MKGVIFNVVEEAVSADMSPDAWDAVLERAGLAGAYTSLGSYSDEDLERIVRAASELLGVDAADLLVSIGRRAFHGLAGRHPQFAQTHPGLRSFLHSVNSVIHPEVLKLYPQATVPVFETSELPGGGICMVYRSPRRLCALAHGLMLGAADHYAERLGVEEVRCTHRGDDRCEFILTIDR